MVLHGQVVGISKDVPTRDEVIRALKVVLTPLIYECMVKAGKKFSFPRILKEAIVLAFLSYEKQEPWVIQTLKEAQQAFNAGKDIK